MVLRVSGAARGNTQPLGDAGISLTIQPTNAPAAAFACGREIF
jgi:hypothetical protein